MPYRRKKKTVSASPFGTMFGTSPFFGIYTNPDLQKFLTPQGQGVANELAILQGGAPLASYDIGQGRVPHVQTSPGVWESGYRARGFADPRWDAETYKQLTGQQSSTNQYVNNEPPQNSQQTVVAPKNIYRPPSNFHDYIG